MSDGFHVKVKVGDREAESQGGFLRLRLGKMLAPGHM